MKKHLYKILLLALVIVGCNQEKESNDTQLVVTTDMLEGDFSQHDSKTNIISPNTLQMDNYFVWGGSVVKGDDGKYHMLFSLWDSGEERAPFQDGWLLSSKIAYAVSDYTDKEFKFQKIVLRGRLFDGDSTAWDAQSVHNPHIKRFNEKYYLYYTGSKDPGVQPIGSPGEKLSKRNRIQQVQKLGVIEFNSFDDLVNGNFQRPEKPLLVPRTRVKENNVVDPSPPGTVPKPDNIIVVNPSVVYRPNDQKYLLYFKGNLWDPHWRGVHGVAISDNPNGPFTAMNEFVFDIRLDDGRIASAEDPYVWYHNKYKKFYATFKDFSGKIAGAAPGLAILVSQDGISWQKPDNSLFMKKELIFKNGKHLKVSNLERPQLLINENGSPVVLYAACSIEKVGGKKDGSTFNVQIPLIIK
ncbi:MAG: glycoside hydrolase family protein [Bacteroidota bacterium]